MCFNSKSCMISLNLSNWKYLVYYFFKLKHNQPQALSPNPDSYWDWERVGGEVCFQINKTRHYILPIPYFKIQIIF